MRPPYVLLLRRQQLLREHHDTLAALLDANTSRYLDRLGIAAGWPTGAVNQRLTSPPPAAIY